MAKLEDTSSPWAPWMRRALQLAALAEGCTSPNPLVGAVVLDPNGKLIGEGFHVRAGMPHAEIDALAQAGVKAKGGTLVVTLEPCCHQGRTPPCTEAILDSGILRVVVALQDPDPRVAGKGISRLREAGLEVITELLEQEAANQNREFIFRVRNGRPWGILKWAMSSDGRIGLPNGESQWISGTKAREWVHCLRAKCDAVIIGGGTLRSDDPLLTSRGLSDPEPLRVVLTRSLDLPAEAQLWNTAKAKTVIAHGPNSVQECLKKLPEGLDRMSLNEADPLVLLNELAERGCNRVLWECGPTLATTAIQKGCVQELAIVMAPKLLGGITSMSPLSDLGFTSMNQVLLLKSGSMHRLGGDWLLNVLLPEMKC
ncbi:bifunctional diaminohydroxyphosphoribosylaminopyrimidine deaminase/5-amino-6-(5-phosphoribosylamino)uracil reductase RibD [Prochlorococcus sp. MIT 1307]|uniref:bifunctional diaminohydroxyphosphoribosylaminopyrimidine deaminase/5-amino-6-(5-phosphoribosylamino)uracil reductase RibD n=1 Tax=Prochlorococcus sp. MIT 1307 TaxID=3096219 RepID=UPI002A74EA3B|nr:bifunctional diaminohydroxyphosphoribosylaminopyrimidine deaminase/5-amino-6-(5-phosphoribosylamino)uracil reductase RibD [Prochlorococcus sp. MIT 1307]